MSNRSIIDEILYEDIPGPQKLTIAIDQAGNIQVEGDASYSFVSVASGSLAAMGVDFDKADLCFLVLYFFRGFKTASENLGIDNKAYLKRFCSLLSSLAEEDEA